MNKRANTSFSVQILLLIALSGASQSCATSHSSKQIQAMPYLPALSGDKLFWELVTERLDIVPALIQELDNATPTGAPVPNFGGIYTVADVAYHALQEIIRDMPTRDFMQVTPEQEGAGGYWYYWNHLRASQENRALFKAKVARWYDQNKLKLVWVPNTSKQRVSRNWPFESKTHPARGHYTIVH
jgi:hypothetical protein